jgi:hypothetical protein
VERPAGTPRACDGRDAESQTAQAGIENLSRTEQVDNISGAVVAWLGDQVAKAADEVLSALMIPAAPKLPVASRLNGAAPDGRALSLSHCSGKIGSDRRTAGEYATTMYVRFRATDRRLQVSLVETTRIAGRVHHNHIASLGSIPNGRSLADRIAFWSKLHQRLATLGNRVDSAMQGVVLTAIHARIPMPTQDEQRVLQIKHARENARFWTTMSEVRTEQIAGLNAVAAKALAEATEGLAAVAPWRASSARTARETAGQHDTNSLQTHPTIQASKAPTRPMKDDN